jgi:hypothetical protein
MRNAEKQYFEDEREITRPMENCRCSYSFCLVESPPLSQMFRIDSQFSIEKDLKLTYYIQTTIWRRVVTIRKI